MGVKKKTKKQIKDGRILGGLGDDDWRRADRIEVKSSGRLDLEFELIVKPNDNIHTKEQYPCKIYLWEKNILYAEELLFLTKDNAIALAHALETVVES